MCRGCFGSRACRVHLTQAGTGLYVRINTQAETQFCSSHPLSRTLDLTHGFSTPRPRRSAQRTSSQRARLVVVRNLLDQVNDGQPQTIMINPRECLQQSTGMWPGELVKN